MRTRHRCLRSLLPLSALAAAALSLAACGGGDGDGAAAEGVATLGTTATTTSTTVATDDDTGASPVDGSVGTAGDVTATDGTDGPLSSDPQEALLDYAACMREHGIDMPDPEFGENGAVTMSVGGNEPGEGPSPEEFEAADAACARFMEAARSEVDIDPEEQAEMQEQMLEFAQCMREHGIDMPDPQFDENGGVSMHVSSDDGGSGQDPVSNDEFQAANEECAQDGGGMALPALNAEAGD